MTDWQPATEAESAMRDALRAEDQELYFRILARTDLLLPVAPDEDGRARIGWGTWTSGGRTHVLAFTSDHALAACLGEGNPTRRIPFHDLAGSWPNQDWWLAVNPGLPIEGYLPAWFVGQLSRGDVRLPGRSIGARARVEAAARARGAASVPPQVRTGGGEPARPISQLHDPARASGRAVDAPRSPGRPADPARPTDRSGDPARSAGRAGDLTRPVDRAADPTWSAGRAGDPARSAGYEGDPGGPVRRAGGPARSADQNADPARPGGHRLVGPSNTAADRDASTAPSAEPRPGGGAAGALDRFAAGRRAARTGSGERAGLGADPPWAAGEGTRADEPSSWSEADTRSGGTARSTGSGRAAAAGALDDRSGRAEAAEQYPGSSSTRGYRDAGGTGRGGQEYGTAVTEPAPADGRPAGSTGAAAGHRYADPTTTEPDSPTQPGSFAEQRATLARGTLGQPGDRPPTVRASSPAPATPPSPQASPEPAFVPANEVEADLLDAANEGQTDTFLSTLLLARVLVPVADDASLTMRPGVPGFRWLHETVDELPFVVVFTSLERMIEHLGGEVPAVTARFVHVIRAWPDDSWSFAVNPGTPVGATLPGSQIRALAAWADEVGLSDEPSVDFEPATEPVPQAAAGEQPVVMQKPIAASQLGYFLERGYDRVSGFVHRASEVAHLDTPQQMATALGLNYPGSPFKESDDEIYLLRWTAYRPKLYRVPYGGRDEAGMRAMQGWVIERPPFRGNGFAPSESSDVIAEFKVDSARLPHGAQMWRLTRDGERHLVATLDVDGPLWTKAALDAGEVA